MAVGIEQRHGKRQPCAYSEREPLAVENHRVRFSRGRDRRASELPLSAVGV